MLCGEGRIGQVRKVVRVDASVNTKWLGENKHTKQEGIKESWSVGIGSGKERTNENGS